MVGDEQLINDWLTGETNRVETICRFCFFFDKLMEKIQFFSSCQH